MTRLVTPDGVDFELRGPRDDSSDLAPWMLGQVGLTFAVMSLPVVGVGVGWAQGQGFPDVLGLLQMMVVFGVVGAIVAVALGEAWWSAGRRRTLAIRSWGLLVDGERLPWDAIEAVGRSDHSFSVVSRTGRHWGFFQPGYEAGAEIAEAVRRGQALSDQVLSEQQKDAMHALTRD